MTYRSFFYFVILCAIFGCSDAKKEKSTTRYAGSDQHLSEFSPEVEHASKFRIQAQNGYTIVTVLSPWQGAKQNYVYVLVAKGQEEPELEGFRKNPNDMIQQVNIPMKRIVLTSTTFVPLLDQLNETASLIGFPGTDHISSSKARKLIDEGRVVDLGAEAQLNIERLINLNPDALMDYAMQGENKSGLL